jgi:hypothetical protein
VVFPLLGDANNTPATGAPMAAAAQRSPTEAEA